MADRWMARAAEMFPAIIGESARWGDYRRDVSVRNGAAPLFTYFNHFLTEQNRLLNSYFPVRSQNVLTQFRSAGLYPTLDAPVFNQHGGAVPLDFNLAMSNNGGTIYYTLDNGGERLAIRDKFGRTVVSVDYDDNNGWPTAPDAFGPSIEIINVDGDPDAPDNWRASAQPDGSPGVIGILPSQGPVRLNELMADNQTAVNHAGTFPDWVELYNAGGQTVDLEGWSLTDDGNPRKFVFPPGTSLLAGQYLVVWCDTNTTPGLHTGFALDRKGEFIALYDAQTNRQDALSFGLQLTDYSLGRLAQGWNLGQPTPEAANQAAPLGSPSSLRINEWLADPVPGQDDWLELYNNSALPVALRGLHLSSDSQAFQIQALSFVAPTGYVQLFATRAPGPDQLDFRLPAVGGAIILHDAGGAQLDQIQYAAAAESTYSAQAGKSWTQSSMGSRWLIFRSTESAGLGDC